MNNLSCFLAGNVEKRANRKVVISTRFKDDKGNAVEWELRNISSGEDEEIRKQCTKQVQVVGKRNQYRPEFDANAYIAKLCTASVVYPNLGDEELQKSYGVYGSDELLRTMLYKDEFDKLSEEVMGITDTDDINELVDEAKN